MKKFVITVGLIGLIVGLFVGAFLLLNFRLMQSQMLSDSTIASYHTGSPDEKVTIVSDVTGLYVDPSIRFAQSLQDEIKSRLENQPQVGEVTAVNLPMDKADIPLLFVEVNQQKKLWTPFYANSAYEVIVYYASNGDISFRHSQPVHFESNSDQQAISYRASYALVDRSFGLISSPGYQDYLVHQIADRVQMVFEHKVKSY